MFLESEISSPWKKRNPVEPEQAYPNKIIKISFFRVTLDYYPSKRHVVNDLRIFKDNLAEHFQAWNARL